MEGCVLFRNVYRLFVKKKKKLYRFFPVPSSISTAGQPQEISLYPPDDRISP